MWPSGLRRVTRNHFSYGGVGSNPAIVVFIEKKGEECGIKKIYVYVYINKKKIYKKKR